MTCTIHFNSKDTYASAKEADDSEDEADGPIVERSCPQCQNSKMSYATLQLRSADEGQTVFYTCTKCKYVSAQNYYHIDRIYSYFYINFLRSDGNLKLPKLFQYSAYFANGLK